MKGNELQCEMNHLFGIKYDDLTDDCPPHALEPHLTFFWSDVKDLQDLDPFPLRKLVQKYVNGSKDV